MLGIFYMIFFMATGFFYTQFSSEESFKKGAIIFIASVIFSLFFVGYSQLTGLFKEGFNFCPSPGPKLCRGGAYTWQGNSPRAEYCRALASTPLGEAEIKSYECGKGFYGMPGGGFKDTPMSDACWNNELCNNPDESYIRSNGIF